MTITDSFRQAIEQCGLTPPQNITANATKLTRFRSGSEKSKNGWYRLVILKGNQGDEIAFGSFGCWKRGVNEKWSSKDPAKYTQYDKARYKREQEKIRRQSEEEARHAAMRAEKIWKRATAPDAAHPYLQRKGIKNPVGIRQHKNSLVIPARVDGQLTSLQFISPDSKLFLTNGTTKGAYCAIAKKDDNRDTLIICEGYATGMSLYAALGIPVVVAFFAGNIPPVTAAIRGKYPEAKIIIAADNDQWSKKPDGTPYNAGIERAVEAAEKYRAQVEFPRFDPKDPAKPTDFNDMAQRHGLSAIRQQFEGSPPDMMLTREQPPADTMPATPRIGDWRNLLRQGKKSLPDFPHTFDGKSRVNVLLFLENHPDFAGIFNYNEFSDQIIIMRCPPWQSESEFTPRPATGDDYTMLATHLERVEISISKDWATDLAQSIARRKENRINPPKDYFNSLQWDGRARLDTWLTYYLGAEQQPAEYLAAVGRKWLTAGVARVFEPGCKFDSVLILEGPQNLGKSMTLRTLATFNGVEYFCDSVGDLQNKDTIMTMQGKIIIEMAELASFKKSENEEIKGFISRQVDFYRPPYARAVEERKRYFILAGSTNEMDDGYLTDRTGNRRYWPVRCGSNIAIEALRRDSEQLWAEAVFLYKNGEKTYLEDDEFAVASREQRDRFTKEAWAEKLTDKLIGKWEVTVTEAADLLELKPRDITNMTRRRIKDALIEIGWFESKREGQGRIWRHRDIKGREVADVQQQYVERDLL